MAPERTLPPLVRRALVALARVALGVAALFLVAVFAFVYMGGLGTKDYTEKSQFSEAPSIVDGLKTRIDAFHRAHGRLPHDNAEAGLAAPASITGKYIDRVEVQGEGVIVARFSPRAVDVLAGKTVKFTPLAEHGGIRWHCTSERISERFCPQACACRASSWFSDDD